MSFRSPENPTVLPLLLANCVSYCNFATLLRQNEDYNSAGDAVMHPLHY